MNFLEDEQFELYFGLQ